MLVQQGRHPVAVGHIARHHGNRRPLPGKLGHQPVHALGVRPLPADQHQVPHPVPGHHMPGHQRPQRTSPRDQHRPVVREWHIEGPRVRECAIHGQSSKAWHREDRAAESELGFATGEGRTEEGRDVCVGVQQDDAVRVFGLGGADQAPDRGCGGVGHVADGHRATGHDHQARLLEPGGKPGLNDLQRPGGHVQRVLADGLVEDHGGGVGQGCEVVGSSHRHPGRLSKSFGRGKFCPFQTEQRVAVAGGTQLLGGNRAGHQRIRRHHKAAGFVRGLDRQGVRAARRKPDTQCRSARGVQDQAVPGEGKHRLPRFGFRGGAEHARVQGGVQQAGVDAEPGAVLILGQGDFGEDLVPAPPNHLQALESRPVRVSAVDEIGVEVPDLDPLCARRRPGGEVESRSRRRRCGRQEPGRVPGPHLGTGVLAQGVHLEGA